MPVTTPVPPSDVASAARAEANPSPPPEAGHINTLLRSLTASWRPVSIVVERRGDDRHTGDLPGVLVPLDRHGRAIAGAPLDVHVQDVSPHGIGITHPEPMVHHVALLAFETSADGPLRLVVRLKWCRFRRAGVYESGGQILRVLKPGDEPELSA
jgi:hypothetical protein